VLALGVTVKGVSVIPAFGFEGVAAGTVAAQWIGLATVACILAVKYRKGTLDQLDRLDFKTLFKGGETRRFFNMNIDLFIRSACMIAVYIGFTTISARYGDLLLAVSSILMKLLLLFSYFTDGFAYAGEALTGRFIGEKNHSMLRQTIKWTFIWSMSIASVFILIYHFFGVQMVKVMTSDMAVIEAAKDYLPWLLLMPIVGCAAFTWDGIYVGATASKGMRNSVIWAVAVFALVWAAGIVILQFSVPDVQTYNSLALHVLMAAYFAHLLARTTYLTIKGRAIILK
jgi:MATE family multidrug resistance protein